MISLGRWDILVKCHPVQDSVIHTLSYYCRFAVGNKVVHYGRHLHERSHKQLNILLMLCH